MSAAAFFQMYRESPKCQADEGRGRLIILRQRLVELRQQQTSARQQQPTRSGWRGRTPLDKINREMEAVIKEARELYHQLQPRQVSTMSKAGG